MRKLNAKEQAVFDYICRVTKEKGYAPSVRDIGEALHYKSTSTVQMYLDRLLSYGILLREDGKSRSLRVNAAFLEEAEGIPILDPADVSHVAKIRHQREEETELFLRRVGENPYHLPRDAWLLCSKEISAAKRCLFLLPKDLLGVPLPTDQAEKEEIGGAVLAILAVDEVIEK